MNITKIERKLTHPGEVLKEEFLKPMNISQSELAKSIGVSFRAVNEIVNEKRNISPEMALRLSKYFKTSPEFWLNLQISYDLYKAKLKLWTAA
jgi:addiction module HigA family antidote